MEDVVNSNCKVVIPQYVVLCENLISVFVATSYKWSRARRIPEDATPPAVNNGVKNLEYFNSTTLLQLFITITTNTTQTSKIYCIVLYRPISENYANKLFSLPADAADEAVWVVSPPQGRYHLSSYVLVTAVTLGPVEALVVLCTDVLARVVEETRMHQITATHCTYRERRKKKWISSVRLSEIRADWPNRERKTVVNVVSVAGVTVILQGKLSSVVCMQKSRISE